MTAHALTANWTRPARLRSSADSFAIGLPFSLAAAALGWRCLGTGAAIVILVVGLAATALTALLRARRHDQLWLSRQLNASRPDMEDSAALLFTSETGLNPLQSLQRARLHARLDAGAPVALRPQWHTHIIAAAWLIGAAVIAAALLWPGKNGVSPLSPSAAAPVAAVGPPRLLSGVLRIVPPAYTGLPAHNAALTSRAPIGSRIVWQFRFAPNPDTARLNLVGAQPIPLTRSGDSWTATRSSDSWTATRSLGASLLYRVTPGGSMTLHRIDAIPDMPPVIRAVSPETTLTLMRPGQRVWPLVFEVTDDYGVAASARLRLIVTSGEGENITFRESSRSISGSGDPKRRRFTASLDIAALGLTPGNDIVAQLIAADNRSPGPQVTRGTSLILRWPPDLGKEAAGLDGMVKTVLPAYFRSQRQIIIDTEALIPQRRKLSDDTFTVRSDTIGVDQRLLRMRYGGLLGDEAAKAPTLPTNDAPADGKTPAATPAAATHGDDDGHDHNEKPAVFGDVGNVLESYGHTHDEAGVATLFDPETRAILRQAVDAMWQSELNLRQGAPEKALPHAYAALGFIKKVQQATRIYLSRTGPDLPPIDPGRRLGGDRKGIIAPSLAPARRESGDIDAIPAAAWRALATAANPDLVDLQRWAGTAPTKDPLALAAAIDAVAQDPGCQPCRDRLRGQLWLAMSPPPAQVRRRPAADAAGQRYLDAMR